MPCGDFGEVGLQRARLAGEDQRREVGQRRLDRAERGGVFISAADAAPRGAFQPSGVQLLATSNAPLQAGAHSAARAANAKPGFPISLTCQAI